jgi:Na+/H+-dicarboxylate symporter
MIPVDESARAAFRSMAGTADMPVVTPSTSAPGIGGWLTGMVPTNPFRAAVDDNFIAVVVSTVIFALAMLRIDPERRSTLVRFFEAAADTTGVVIRWLIYLLPIAAFTLSFVIAAETGLSVATSVAYYIAALSALLLVMTVLLYPATAIIGRVSLRRFFTAALPALAVGAGTRSSIAALPAMLDGAENKLGVRREVSGFVLPLSVSTFKLNPAISQPVELFFFMAMFGLSASPAVVLSFVAATLLLAFASAGIPSGSKLISWPIFLAMGVPVEALVMMKVIDAIPDIFKTMLNVTADLSATVIVQRFAGQGAPEPVGPPVLAPVTE